MRRLFGSLLFWGAVIAGLAMLREDAFHAGYGRAARDIGRLVIEMRQGATEAPDSWENGEI